MQSGSGVVLVGVGIVIVVWRTVTPGYMTDDSNFICRIYTSPINAHRVIWAFGIYVTFEGHIFTDTYMPVAW